MTPFYTNEVKPNRSLGANISMIRATTEMGDRNERKMSSTQLDSYANMVVVGKHVSIIQNYGKSANVRPFSNEC